MLTALIYSQCYSPLKLELLASKFSLLNPKSEENLSLFLCCGHFMEKNEKFCLMKKSVYDSEWITFVSLTSVSRFALNKIFSLAEISQRKEDPFSRKLTSRTNFYVIHLITELSSFL